MFLFVASSLQVFHFRKRFKGSSSHESTSTRRSARLPQTLPFTQLKAALMTQHADAMTSVPQVLSPSTSVSVTSQPTTSHHSTVSSTLASAPKWRLFGLKGQNSDSPLTCLLYTSDAADEEDSVDLGGRRIIKKKKRKKQEEGKV
eukprot:TRINITY_DN43669_c0_g1_i2.p2 TRINITY_DN43669_c0_g1~~TRINITY_DN43669_c0_g1_i2.p2  ORF type:complete len:145 (-),score=12.66 TRINITY_DN43669_c0_g1_i2:48-482(-)